MNSYITLMKLTDQGAKNLKDAPKRIDEGIKGLERSGGKLIGFYSTLGEYDYIAVAEGPSDEAAAAVNLALCALGYVKTTTLRAFTVEEFTALIQKIP
jgi:uncharacterized protein with GYD domain